MPYVFVQYKIAFQAIHGLEMSSGYPLITYIYIYIQAVELIPLCISHVNLSYIRIISFCCVQVAIAQSVYKETLQALG